MTIPIRDDASLLEIYRLDSAAEVETPALLVYPDLVRENIARAVEWVGNACQLRPHAKTHKTREIALLALEAGIQKQKCATIAEAEVLAEAGVPDIILAYPLIGPTIKRFHTLRERFPRTRFVAIFDHPDGLAELAKSASQQNPIDVMIDIDLGMGRTGIPLGDAALALALQVMSLPGLSFAGIHAYDGHVSDSDETVRATQVDSEWDRLQLFVRSLEVGGLPVPAIVVSGTGGFTRWAVHAKNDSRLELSPGTIFLHDAGYRSRYREIVFAPAACLIGRVVSKPAADSLTVDLGYKAVSPDPSLVDRLVFLNLPGARITKQSEEHVCVTMPTASEVPLGEIVYAWPWHICPTVALHRELLVVRNHSVETSWLVRARDRHLSV